MKQVSPDLSLSVETPQARFPGADGQSNPWQAMIEVDGHFHGLRQIIQSIPKTIVSLYG
jgi:hypothetical protein